VIRKRGGKGRATPLLASSLKPIQNPIQNRIHPIHPSRFLTVIVDVLVGRQLPPAAFTPVEELAGGGTEPSHAVGNGLTVAPQRRSGAVVLLFSTAVFVLTVVLNHRAIAGIGGDAVWPLDLLATVALAVQWRLRGALAGVAVAVGTFAVFEAGGDGWRGFQAADTRAVLVMGLLLNTAVPLTAAWLMERLSRLNDAQRLAKDAVRMTRGAEAAVRASEERFRSLVQNASDIMTVLDADGNHRYVSVRVQT